jgi:beta-lactamase superfamily II metal-dependent hydrolase
MSLKTILKQGFGFATYPFVHLFDEVSELDKKTKKKVKKWKWQKQLLFGDFIKPVIQDGAFVEKEHEDEVWIRVRARNRSGYIKKDEIQGNRVLEVNFIDIGQGDGCHIVTPDDEHIILDAGVSDNMYRFLKWRFNLKKANIAPPDFTAIISHSDSDHYKGFNHLFTRQNDLKQQFNFTRVYHNGIVEMSGEAANKLGKTAGKGKDKRLMQLFEGDAELKKHLKNVKKPSLYESTLQKAVMTNPDVEFSALWRNDVDTPQFLPGFTGVQMEILGPVVKQLNNKKTLPYFDNPGRTKNGHSVVLKVTLGKVKILLGGDLNPPAEDYLMSCYSGKDIAALRSVIKKAKTGEKMLEAQQDMDTALEGLKEVFEVDVAKSCHHGSADFTHEFLQCVNPIATVISSGDDEPHCHPRPDTLGTIGRYSRGSRSLIFSTELARSAKEFILKKDMRTDLAKQRVVTVYGMINLRSDGEKVIIAQKLERKAAKRGWDIHKLEWNEDLRSFEYIRKEEA